MHVPRCFFVKRWLVSCLAIGLPFAGSVAFAAPSEEVTTLEARLSNETTELSTSDCAAACKALASIRRAADRICELEPGPRCDAARSKADEATRRVREACPECTIARGPTPDDERRAVQPSAPVAESRPPASAPASERSEARGCRHCATSSGAPDHGDFAVFGLVVALLGRRLARRDGAPRRKTRSRL